MWFKNEIKTFPFLVLSRFIAGTKNYKVWITKKKILIFEILSIENLLFVYTE